MSMNKVILVGHLGKNPELGYTQSGVAHCKFSLATSEIFRKDEATEKRTEWHNISVWGKRAEVAEKFLKKGQKVFIEGKLQTNKWEDKEGISHRTTSIVASTLEFFIDKGDEPSTPTASPTPSPTQAPAQSPFLSNEESLTESEIPF